MLIIVIDMNAVATRMKATGWTTCATGRFALRRLYYQPVKLEMLAKFAIRSLAESPTLRASGHEHLDQRGSVHGPVES